jgi:hypothetical protein
MRSVDEITTDSNPISHTDIIFQTIPYSPFKYQNHPITIRIPSQSIPPLDHHHLSWHYQTAPMVVLKEHLTTRKRETLKKGWKETPEWLFYNEVGQMINVGNLRKRVFYKCLEKAGLRRITIHQLRHTYATLRIQAGHNIADVQRQLGHHSIKVTVDTYYHYMPGTGNTEVNDLDQNCAPIRTLSAPSHDSANEKGAAI